MKLKGQHKAIIITVLSVGILVFGIFSIHLKQNQSILETFYDLQAETELVQNIEQTDTEGADAKTNEAFNEDKAIDDLINNMQTFTKADLEDTKQNDINTSEDEVSNENETSIKIEDYSISKAEKESFEKLQQDIQKQKNKGNQTSTFSYFLKDRKLVRGKTPRYLCESEGKIVVDISVNAQGYVVDSKVNTTQSNSTNGCLTETALEYAKKVRFNSALQELQQGTITYFFKGK